MSATPSTTRPPYLPTLDGLRGVAVLLVLGTHTPQACRPTGASWLDHALSAGGYLGVDVFFVLSGFLITRILLREPGREVLPFVLRRAARIFPLYYALLGVCALLAPEAGLAWSAVYLSNYWLCYNTPALPLGHLWSLSVEEHFYLAWPWLVKRLPRRQSLRALVGVILPGALLVSILLVVLSVPAADGLVYRGTQTRILSLGIGALAAYREPAMIALSQTVARRWLPTGLGVAAALVGGVALARLGLGQVGFLISYAVASTWLLMMALGTRAGGRVERALREGALPEVGKVSYGVYLFHPFVYEWLVKAWPTLAAGTWPMFALTLIGGGLLTYGLAWGSYHAFEARIVHLVRAWSRRRQEAPLDVAGPPSSAE